MTELIKPMNKSTQSYQIRKDHKTTQWSGGSTTELFIYPENSQYKTGDYQFRLSTATVEVEESIFTSLPSVDRTLMVLEGEMELDHANHHTALLKPLDSDQFKGDWTTSSKGRCVDFNLMCKSGTQGAIKGYNLAENSELEIEPEGEMTFIFLYRGAIEADKLTMNQGELLIAHPTSSNINLRAIRPSTFVVVSIKYLP